MSNFSYPPPPPPPPPPPAPSSAAPYSSSQNSRSSHKIPSFQSRNDGRSRKHDGRGGHQGGRGPNHKQSNAHAHAHAHAHANPPSGGQQPRSHMGHPSSASLSSHPAQNQVNYQGHPSAGQPYRENTYSSWTAPQYPGAGPYGNPYAPAIPSHAPQQYYSQAPVPGQPYVPHPPSYSAAIVPPYQPNAFQYPPPPPAPPSLAQHIRPGYEDRQGGGQRSQNSHHRSPDSGHGQKRKREQSPSRMQCRSGSSGQPPNKVRGGQSFNQRPKVKTAPPVPSFSFHGLPPKPPTTLDSSSARVPNTKETLEREWRKKQKKRKPNQLGLTPKGDFHDASDEDVDEEAQFADSGASVTIQFRGRVMSVTTATEIQAWIAERKKNFPTQARGAERKALQEKRKKESGDKRKQAAEEQRKAQKAKRQEQQAKKKVKQQKKNKGDAPRAEPKVKDEVVKAPVPSSSKEDDQERQRKRLEKHLRKAEKLRELLAQAEINDDPVDKMDNRIVKTEQDAANPSSEGQHQPQQSENNSSHSNGSSGTDSDSDSSAAPEVEPIKGGPEAAKMLPPPKRDTQSGPKNFTDVPCKYFIRDGHCRRKNCRFLHLIPKKSDKMTLFERLKEGEMHERSLRTLDLIKRLGQVGLLD